MKAGENFKFFCNNKCEYFPCHRVNDESKFNCLFCYCPLYALGDQCGGNFTYTDKGIKNCTNCTVPHKVENYEYIMEKMKGILEIARKKDINEE